MDILIQVFIGLLTSSIVTYFSKVDTILRIIIFISSFGVVFCLFHSFVNRFLKRKDKKEKKQPEQPEKVIIPKESGIKVELSTSGRKSQNREANIIIINLKENPVTIVRVLTKEKNGPLVELSTQGFDLPQTIKYQNHIKLASPYIAHNIDKIERICVEDTEGKRWDVDNETFNQAKKVLSNFIGNRLIYPTMGDELDEDKIK